MGKNDSNKIIGYAITALAAYWILQMLVPYLIVIVVGMVFLRLYMESKNK
jgi:hypothetical protein